MNTRFEHLYKQYIDDTCTKEEREEFLSMVAENLDSDSIGSLMDDTWDKIGTEKLIFPTADKVLHNIYADHPKFIVKKINWYLYFSAVAAIFTFVTIGIYFYEKSDNHTEIKSNTVDIQAGTNKAILTLADGSTINLDNVTNGEIADQAGIAIIKTNNGKLIYEVSKNITKENTADLYNTITTPRGGQYQINLPDGTIVWLNAASSLKYPTVFDNNKRKVYLSGEAYFEVAKISNNTGNNKNKSPFIVATDKQEIEVLGTHFNVDSYPDDQILKTTLLEGAVNVRAVNKNLLLKPGQQSILRNNSLTSSIVDVEESVAWKNGYFSFNENLESLMNKVSRWYDVDVIYEIKPESDSFIAKISRKKSLSALLKIIEQTGDIHFRIEGRRVTVTK